MHNLFLLNSLPMFNELKIKHNPLKKTTPGLVFMEASRPRLSNGRQNLSSPRSR